MNLLLKFTFRKVFNTCRYSSFNSEKNCKDKFLIIIIFLYVPTLVSLYVCDGVTQYHIYIYIYIYIVTAYGLKVYSDSYELIPFLSAATHKLGVSNILGRRLIVRICRFHFYQQQLINLVYVRFGEVTQSRNIKITFLSTATHKLGVASVSGK